MWLKINVTESILNLWNLSTYVLHDKPGKASRSGAISCHKLKISVTTTVATINIFKARYTRLIIDMFAPSLTQKVFGCRNVNISPFT